MNDLGLEERDFALVQDILREHSGGRVVWAFGSGAKGTRVKKYSDLDLAVEGGLTLHESARLSEAFEESLLPIKVDVVELDAITPQFRARIEKDFVLVQEGSVLAHAPGALPHEHVPA